MERPTGNPALPASKLALPASKLALPASKLALPASKLALPALERFVVDLLGHEGAIVETLEPGVALALGGERSRWPAEAELVRLVFDPEAIHDHPDGAPVFFGTPRADELLDRGRALAPIGRAWRADLPTTSREIVASARRVLHAQDAAIELGPGRARYDARALFVFRATYVGEEREEDLHAAGVDMALGRPSRGLEDWTERGALVADRPLPLPDGPVMPLRSAVRLAWQEVVPRVHAARRAREDAAARRIGVEKERLAEYFEEGLKDLAARAGAAPPGEAPEWEARRRATLAERERRFAELAAKEVVRVEASLASVLLIWAPRIASTFCLVRKETRSAPVELLYDPAEETVLPPDCPSCRRPTTAWRLAPREVGASEPLAVCAECVERKTKTVERRR